MTKQTRNQLIKWAIALVGFGVLVYAARDLDVDAVFDSMRNIDPALGLLAAALVIVGKVGAKVVRSQILLVDQCTKLGIAPPTWATTARLLVASHAAGQLAWGPLGFTVRGFALHKDGMPLGAIAKVHVVERIAEAIGIAVIALAALVIAPDFVLGSLFGRILLGALGLCAVFAIVVLVSRRLRYWFERYAGVGRALVKSSVWAFVSSLADIAVLVLVARGLQVDLDPATAMLAFLAVNGACAVPVTPAQIGVQESAIVVVLGTAGIAAPVALAVALAYRAAHVVPLALIGLPALIATWIHRPTQPEIERTA